MAKLINRADASADYLGFTYFDIDTVTVDTSVLSVKKTVDKALWLDNDPLTYTVQITNNVPEPGAIDVMNIIFKDLIDPEIALLDTNSVTLNGASQTLYEHFSYNIDTGLLYFFHVPSIPGKETSEIKYRVTKK